MATFNWASIEAKAQKAIDKSGTVDKYMMDAKMKGGVKTASGQRVIGVSDMQEAANAMIKIVAQNTSGLPSSVASDGASLTINGGISPSLHGETKVGLSFAADLSRPGLHRLDSFDVYPGSSHKGEGYQPIYNIIALFNNGWNASNYVYGEWTSVGAWVRSKKSGPALQFMQKSRDTFNSSIGGKYNCKARLSPMYTGGGANLMQFRG